MLVKVEGVEGTAEAGLEVAQHGVDPPDLREVFGMLAPGDDSLVVAVGCGLGSEAGQPIGENMAAGRDVAFGPFRDQGCDPGVNWMAIFVQGTGCDDRNLVF